MSSHLPRISAPGPLSTPLVAPRAFSIALSFSFCLATLLLVAVKPRAYQMEATLGGPKYVLPIKGNEISNPGRFPSGPTESASSGVRLIRYRKPSLFRLFSIPTSEIAGLPSQRSLKPIPDPENNPKSCDTI